MPYEAGTTWTIVVAAGSGSRFGGETPKQFLEIAGQRVVDWAVSAAASVSDGVVVVVPKDSTETAPADARLTCPVNWVPGGDSRSESVRNGLAHVPASAQVVLVHDAARPVASVALMQAVTESVRDGADAVVPVVDVVDTIRDRDGNTVDRSQLQAVQTPQGFAARALRRAHQSGSEATDDATLVTLAGGTTVTVPGERWNVKITEPEDALVIEALLAARR